MLKIATWNVNSLRVRLPHVLQWLQEAKPDVLALQETKVLDTEFPIADIQRAGYECVFSGQKTYNGMAILSKKKSVNVLTDISEFEDQQRRLLGVTIDDIRILNVYVPNGQSVASEKYAYKLQWLQQVDRFLQLELKKYPKFILLGDFNIAPAECDVYDPQALSGQILFSEQERAAFQGFIRLGLQDCFRLQAQPEKSFSWWDYRLNAFKRNMGLRIDHILASDSLIQPGVRCYIDKMPRTWERPSDHTPVIAEFEVQLSSST